MLIVDLDRQFTLAKEGELELIDPMVARLKIEKPYSKISMMSNGDYCVFVPKLFYQEKFELGKDAIVRFRTDKIQYEGTYKAYADLPEGIFVIVDRITETIIK